jgi:hypothetical protein
MKIGPYPARRHGHPEREAHRQERQKLEGERVERLFRDQSAVPNVR